MRSRALFETLILTLALGVLGASPGQAGCTSPCADLAVTKLDDPDPAFAGSTLTYEIDVFNNGPNDAPVVSFDDTLPAGTTFLSLDQPGNWSCSTPAVGASGTVTCSIDPLPAFTSAFFFVVVTIDSSVQSGTVISNTATVSSEANEASPGNESATATTTVLAGDLAVSKTDAPDPVAPGANITYTITVSSSGVDDGTFVSLDETVPSGTTLVSFAPDAPNAAGWTCDSTNDPILGCSVDTFPAGSTQTFTLVVTVDAATQPSTVISNTATVSAETGNDDSKNDSATTNTVVQLPTDSDLSVTKTDSPDPVLPGDDVTYTITVANAGPAAATAAHLLDSLPAGTTFTSLVAPAGWTCAAQAVGSTDPLDCTANSAFVIGSAVFTMTLTVDPSVVPGTVIFNGATVSSSNDPNEANDAAGAETTVAAPVVVTGTKSVGGTFTPGGTVTYTVVLTNNGLLTQGDNPGREFTDVLPSSLTLVSASATSGTAVATVATNTVTWDGSLAAGASVTITITATVNAAVPAGTTITNQGTIAYDGDANGSNESTGVTDDPATGAANDPTSFVVAGGQQPPPPAIPSLDGAGLALLAGLLALGGVALLRRRREV
jgi:uncharacterized repeat protein (TIGR01451 family)/MYXO-CTERM domain-containing protein